MVDADEHDEMHHLVGGGGIAFTATDVPTLRGFQVKGRVDRLAPPTAEDRVRIEHHAAGVFADIEATDHIAVGMIRRILPFSFVACELVVEELFDQTPGPGAGAAVTSASGAT